MTDVARIAYLKSPSPGVFVLNLQPEGSEGISRFEITKAHLANILITGTDLALRDSSNRVPSPQTERVNVRATSGA